MADTNLTTEQRLKALYDLQTILSQIDRIRQVRGELPTEVRDIEDNIMGLNTRIDNYHNEIEELNQRISQEKAKIEEATTKIDTYRHQIDDVQNNKQYDMLTKEIEFQELEIQLAEKHILEHSHAIDNRNADIAATQEALEDKQHALTDKRKELEEITSETRAEEENLREQVKQLEAKFDDRDPVTGKEGQLSRLLTSFKRIRKNARNGLGIVYVQRNACGGCFNRIPPQMQMEIKMHKKIKVCEYCGRIMIDPELAGIEIENPEKEK